jgi:hypothetical protein
MGASRQGSKMMARLPDWEERLGVYVASARERPHEYGRHDCMLHWAGAVEAVTGEDHGAGHRGKYRNRVGAYRYLKRLGFDSPEALLDDRFEQVPAAFAQRGDIVLAGDGIPAVCMGAFALSVGEQGDFHGLVCVPRTDWVKAWRVG